MLYKTLLLLGHSHRVIGNVDTANTYYYKAEDIAKKTNNEDRIVLAFIYQQLCIYITGSNDKPIENLKPLVGKDALSVSTKGILHQALGNIYRSAADWHNSQYNFEESIQLAKEGDEYDVMEREAELGRMYRSSGCYSEALKRQKSFLQFSICRGYRYSVAAACGYIGFTYYSMGKSHYEEAVRYLYCRLELSKNELDDTAGYRWCLNNIGKVYLGLNEHDMCLRLFTESGEIAKRIGNMLGLGTAYGNMGTACRAVGRHADAIKYHKLYLEIAEGNFDTGGVAIMQNELILDHLILYKEEVDTSDKIKMLNTARKYAFQALATGLEVRSRLAKDDDLLKIANFEKNQAKTVSLLQYILIEQGQKEAALLISELGRAQALADLVGDKLKATSQFLTDIVSIADTEGNLNSKQLYSTMCNVGSLLHRLNSQLLVYSIVNNPLSTGTTVDSRLYTWHVSRSETDNKVIVHFNQAMLSQTNNDDTESVVFNEEYFHGLMHKVRGTSTDLIKEMPSRTHDMDALTSRDIIPRKKDSTPVPIRQQVAQKVQEKDKLEELYSLLFEPVSKHILHNGDTEVTRLIIIPQGFLFGVPFPALKGPGFYLIEKLVTSLSPSIYLLQLALQKKLSKLIPDVQSNLCVFAVGNPKMPLDEIEQLPGAENEVKSILSIVDGKMLCSLDATKNEIVKCLPDFPVVHLATHAILEDSLADHFTSTDIKDESNDFSIKGAIILAKSGPRCSGVLTSSEIKELNLESNELFVLSCCNTARGKVTGDGILGLSRSLMCAGATNMIVTLWPIHDSSTSVLMKNFYSRYRLCRDAPASLRYSMLYHIQQQYKEEHWAAFCCLGVNILASSHSE